MYKFSLHIVTYNSEKYIIPCINSILNQNYTNWSIIIVDNNSQDKTKSILKDKFESNSKITLIYNSENRGFAPAHNQAIRASEGDFIVVMNPDVIIAEDFLLKADDLLYSLKDKYKRVGSICPKVYSVDSLDNLSQDTIDVLYLHIDRKRQIINKGAGERDKDSYNAEKIVFGPSGSLAIYSRSALEDIKIDNEYFDEDFHSYKEDADLAWRMYKYGWKSVFIPDLKGYHIRYAKKGDVNPLRVANILKQRKNKNKFVNRVSYRNHIYTLIKNESLSDFKHDFLYIFIFEVKKFIFLLLFEISTLKGVFDVFKTMPKMIKKRKIIQSKSIINSIRDILSN